MEAACTTPINSSEVYNTLEHAGIEYGALFKGLADLRIGHDVAAGTLSIPDTAADMPYQFENKLIAHLVTLDTCTQIIWAIMMVDPRYAAGSRVCISHDMNSKVGGNLRLYGKVVSNSSSGKEVTASTFVVDPEKSSGAFAMEIDGLRLSRVAQEETEPMHKKISFKTIWKPHYGFLGAKQCQAIMRLPWIMHEAKMKMHLIDQSSLYFIDDALRQVPRDQYVFLPRS